MHSYLTRTVRPSFLNQAIRRQFASGTQFEKFDFEDPFKLNDLLTDEERDIQEIARAYAQEKLQPRVRKAYNDESFDLEIMKEMG